MSQIITGLPHSHNQIDMFDVIAFDADDTLWHNEILYEQIQRKLIDLLADYGHKKTIIKRLYATEMANLEFYGYGIKSFTLSMIETAVELTQGKISGAQIQQIIGFGREMLTADVQLLEHVAETIDLLSRSYRLMVLTKGDLRDQQWKLARSEIGNYFEYVEIVSEKSQQSYSALLEKHDIIPGRFLMVGNSLPSDVLPVVALGGHAVHIPYHTTWQHEQIDGSQVDRNGYFELEHLGQLPELLGQISTSASSHNEW